MALAFGPKGFEVDAIASSVVMMTMTAVWVLAFARVTMEGGTVEGFFARAGFGGAVGTPRVSRDWTTHVLCVSCRNGEKGGDGRNS